MENKLLILCEGPNEKAIIDILLEADRLRFTPDDLLGLVSYHARQISSSSVVKLALSLYPGKVDILRVGDTMSEKLRIPSDYVGKIHSVKKYCTKPELEMLLILSENLLPEYEKVKSKIKPKTFSKNNIIYNRQRYNNITAFYHIYYGKNVDLLVDSIHAYRRSHGAHKQDEHYLADLLK